MIKIPTRVSLGSTGLERAAMLLSFVIPALIRWIPEAQFPYPIGFDTPIRLAEAKTCAGSPALFPLLIRVLGWFCIAGADPILVMKYLPTVLYGLLGVSAYYFARSYLGWDRKGSILAAVVLAFSIASLRVSWDLNKQVFATIFLFLALSQLGNLRSPCRIALFVGFGLLVASSHQLIFALMSGILSCLILFEVYRFLTGRGRSMDTRVIVSLSVTLLGGLLVFLGAWYRGNLSAVYFSGTVSLEVDATVFGYMDWLASLEKYMIIFALSYVLLLPLVVLGFFRGRALTAWLLVATVGSFSILFSPWLSLRSPSRWMYLLVYPFAFYIVAAFGRLKLTNSISLRKGLALLALLLVVNITSISFLGLYPWPAWLPVASGYFPESMALSSIPAHDIEATAQLLESLNHQPQDLVLIVNINYLGWARYFSEHQMVAWAPWARHGPRTLVEALDEARSLEVKDVYLLWYSDQDAVALGFSKFLENGSMKLYKYEN